MRKSLVLVLPVLLAACADNALAPGSVTPSIQSIECTQRFIDSWPEPYELRLQAELPDPAQQEYSAVVSVLHIASNTTLEWTLLDDGDLLSLGEGVDGQLSHSGDNIPGDGIFTALIDPAFTELYGDFSLSFRLLADGLELASRDHDVTRVSNTAPVIDSVEMASVLASGDTLDVSVSASDSDGADDILAVQLVNTASEISWELFFDGDSYTRQIGPSLAAGCQGPTDLLLQVVDHSEGLAEQQLSVDLANTPPELVEDELKLEVYNDGWELLAGAEADTLMLEIPPEGETAYFHFCLPVVDEQTAQDLDVVQVVFVGQSTGFTTVIPGDDAGSSGGNNDAIAGDGVYTMGFEFPGRAPDNPFANMSYELTFGAVDRVGQQATAVTRIMQLYFPE